MANKYTDFQNGLAMALAAGAASGGAGVTEITKAEYDALSEEEKNNGKLYLINDYAEGGIVSSDVSGMESTVLWEGRLSTGSASLTNDISDYDLILVNCNTADNGYGQSLVCASTDINVIKAFSYYTGNGWNYYILFHLNSREIVIDASQTNGYPTASISKVTGLKFKAKVYKPENEYSLEEKRIGTWIDGKPVYQKVLSGLDISWSGDRVWRTVSPDISDLHIENLVSCVGLSSGRPVYFNFTKIYNNVIQAYVMAGWSVQTLILQYTKTTD